MDLLIAVQRMPIERCIFLVITDWVAGMTVAPCGLSSLTNTRTSSLSTNSSSRNITRAQGEYSAVRPYRRCMRAMYIRWHEHDPEEIQQVSEACIAHTCAKLEEAGWAKESVKVIGTCVRPTSSRSPSIMNINGRHHEPTRNHYCVESDDRKAPVQGHRLD